MPRAEPRTVDLSKIVAACPPDPEAESAGPGEDLPPDPNRIDYRPLPHQARFHELCEPEKAMLGGLGSGKSAAGVMEAVYRILLNQARPHVGVIGAPTYPMLRDSALPAWQRWVPPSLLTGGRWDTAMNRSAMALSLLGGRCLVLFRTLGETHYERLRNIEIGWGGIEEASLLRDDAAWNVLLGRLRGRVLAPALWAITTLRGENWVAKKWILEPRSGTACVRARSVDNTYLPDGYLERLRLTYSERFARQELDGEIVTPEGSVYPKLSPEPWPKGNVLVHQPDRYAPTWLAVDFGRRRPAVIAVQRVSVRHPATGAEHPLDVIVWELQGRNGAPPQDVTVDEWLPDVQGQGYVTLRAIHGDPAGDSRNDQTHETSALKLVRALRVPFLPPSAAWQRSKERGEETVAARICSAAGLRSLVWAARPEVDRLGRHIMHAPNSFRSLQALQYPERTARGQAVESLKDGLHDHDADALRYLLVMLHGRERDQRPWEGRQVVG